MSTKRNVGLIVAIVGVLYVYTFFGSIGTMSFPRVRWDQSFKTPTQGYYSSLAEGYLRGRLDMAHRPDPRLMAMPFPYDFETRGGIVPYLWDASYINGKYYLYFSSLPALLFYLPVRVLGGSYPNDQLAGTLFGAWAFVMSALFVRRALANRPLHVPLHLWVITLGLASIVPFVITYCRTYEIAILCGAAMSATWMYALLRFLEAPSALRVFWASLWLPLAIAARPNLGVLIAIHLFALATTMKGRGLAKMTVVAMIPLVVTGSALMLHNYARFRDAFEFGLRYQLSYGSMDDHHVCGVRSVPEALRFLNTASLYTFAPPYFHGEFPFIDLRKSALDPAVTYAATDVGEQIGGLAPLAPLAILGSLCAVVVSRPGARDAGVRGALLSVAAGWFALFGLCSCWYVCARYAVDFWFPISAGAIVCIEATLSHFASNGLNVRPMRVLLIIAAVESSLAGLMLGFSGPERAFRLFNPELYERLSRWFSVT